MQKEGSNKWITELSLPVSMHTASCSMHPDPLQPPTWDIQWQVGHSLCTVDVLKLSAVKWWMLLSLLLVLVVHAGSVAGQAPDS